MSTALETIVTAALTAAIIQLLPYGWRRVVSEIKRAKIAQPAESGVAMMRQRPPTPKLDSFLATRSQYLGSPEYILRVTEKDLEGAKSMDAFLASGSEPKFTPQEIEHLLSGDSDATELSNVWSVPDKEYEDKLKVLDEIGRRNFNHMKEERARYLGNKSS
jgi:hypothetical protein